MKSLLFTACLLAAAAICWQVRPLPVSSFAAAVTQSAWFAILLPVSAVLAIAVVYRSRIWQVSLRAAERHQAQSDERRRIARVLHDGLLQDVYALLLQVQTAISRLPEGEPARKWLEDAQQAASRAVDEGIDQIRELRLELLDAGDVIDALQAAARKTNRTNCRVVIEGELPPLDCRVTAEIFAIIREAMTNALRHADATQIEVLFHQTRAGFQAMVRDNGVGMSASDARVAPGHFGWTGMRERADAIRGELFIESAPGSGTIVTLQLKATPFGKWNGG